MRSHARGRWIAFLLVGLAGFTVQIVALQLLTRGGLPYVAGTVVAVELAILHNFLWHERWTWRDRATVTPKGRLQRFARFNGVSGIVSLLGNVVMTMVLVERVKLPLPIANTLAVATLSALNFTLADRWVFLQRTDG